MCGTVVFLPLRLMLSPSKDKGGGKICVIFAHFMVFAHCAEAKGCRVSKAFVRFIE